MGLTIAEVLALILTSVVITFSGLFAAFLLEDKVPSFIAWFVCVVVWVGGSATLGYLLALGI